MDFSLNSEQRDIQKAAQEFAKGEFDPDAALQHDQDQEFPSALHKKASELGFVGIHIPEEFGGQGLGLIENTLVAEAFCRSDSGLGMAMALSDFGFELILRQGNAGQKQRILPVIAQGKGMPSVAWFEEGYPLYPFATFAKKQNQEYSLQGRKSFVPMARKARYLIVACQTGAEDPFAQSVLVLDDFGEDIQVTGMGDMVGMRMIPMDEVSFHTTRIPETNRIGEENRGHGYLMDFFNEMRVETGAMGVGIAQGALDRALEYSTKREQFGRSIATFDVIRNKLADMFMNTELARLAVYRAAWAFDAGKPDPRAMLLAKHIGAKTAYEVAFEAVQIQGGLGYMKESAIEHYFRDARVLDLFLEPGQIQRTLMADHLLGERRRK